MRKTSAAARAVLIASLLSQTTGAADVAGVSGYGARPLLYPPPVKLASAPRKTVRPAGPSAWRRFCEDARVVEQWLERWLEPPPRAAAPVAWPTSSLVRIASPALAEPERASDRMMVVREPGFVGVAAAAEDIDDVLPAAIHPVIYARRWEGPWREGRGVRFRVNFYNIYGVTRGTDRGFWVDLAHGFKQFVPAAVPSFLHGDYPIFFHNDRVEAEIEIENTSGRSLDSLQTAVRQEELTGASTGDAAVTLELPGKLAPGETAVLPYNFRLGGRGRARVNFEQTHLVVTSGEDLLADEAKAAVVDPPNL